jgi:hypothetical protein
MIEFVGKRLVSGFLMLRPFCDKAMVVLPTVMTDSIMSAR